MVTRCLAEPDARPGIAGLLSWPLPRGTNAQNLTGQERLAGNVHISAAPVLSTDPSGKDYRAPDMKSHHPVTHSTASDVCCRSPATCLSDTAPRELLPSGHFPREEPWAQGSDSSGIRGPGRRRYRATPDHRATLQSQAAKAARHGTVTLQSLKRDGEKKRALAMGPHVSLQEHPPPPKRTTASSLQSDLLSSQNPNEPTLFGLSETKG